jgi:hypothetical protein
MSGLTSLGHRESVNRHFERSLRSEDLCPIARTPRDESLFDVRQREIHRCARNDERFMDREPNKTKNQKSMAR